MGMKTYVRRAYRSAGVPPTGAGGPACAIKGCKLPWREHFGKTGKLKKEFGLKSPHGEHRAADWQVEFHRQQEIRARKRKKEKV
jgi:hypothetical protein